MSKDRELTGIESDEFIYNINTEKKPYTITVYKKDYDENEPPEGTKIKIPDELAYYLRQHWSVGYDIHAERERQNEEIIKRKIQNEIKNILGIKDCK